MCNLIPGLSFIFFCTGNVRAYNHVVEFSTDSGEFCSWLEYCAIDYEEKEQETKKNELEWIQTFNFGGTKFKSTDIDLPCETMLAITHRRPFFLSKDVYHGLCILNLK